MTRLKSQVEPDSGYKHRVHRSKKNRKPKGKWIPGADDSRYARIQRKKYLEELSFNEQLKWDQKQN